VIMWMQQTIFFSRRRSSCFNVFFHIATEFTK
jgi:hypothetical protein